MTAVVPNLFLIGAQKCGTTSAYRFLVDQAGIDGPALKEPNYLSYREGKRNLKWSISNRLYRHNRVFTKGAYLKLFSCLAPDARWLVDGSASYLYGRNTAQEIEALSPDARIIVLLRNPVDRAASEFRMQVAIGAEGRTLAKAVAAELKKGHEALKPLDRRYIWHGKYDLHLPAYLKRFDRKSIHVDCVDMPGENLNDVFCRIAGFLDVPTRDLKLGHRENVAFQSNYRRLNTLLYKTGMKAALAHATPLRLKDPAKRLYYRASASPLHRDDRRMLWQTRQFDVEGVEAMTGLNLAHWRADREASIW